MKSDYLSPLEIELLREDSINAHAGCRTLYQLWNAEAAGAPADEIAKLKAAIELIDRKQRTINTAFEAAKALAGRSPSR